MQQFAFISVKQSVEVKLVYMSKLQFTERKEIRVDASSNAMAHALNEWRGGRQANEGSGRSQVNNVSFLPSPTLIFHHGAPIIHPMTLCRRYPGV